MVGLNVQLPNSLYSSLKELSMQYGTSVDQFIAIAVAEKISALTYLKERAESGSREKYDAVLSKVPNVEPEEYDRLPN